MKDGNRVIRIKFHKLGLMKYIGHLDTQRYFQRVIRRSGIDVAYSEGFSPHQILSFAQPLSVGVESLGEYFDLEVKSYASSEDMMKRMNEFSTEEARVIGMSLLPERPEKAMAEVSAASYTVRFRPGREPSWDILGAVSGFKEADSVLIMKKTKKSEKEIDIKSLVHSLSVSYLSYIEAFPYGIPDDIPAPEKKVPVLNMTVSASSGDNIKPELMIRALRNIAEDSSAPDYPGKTDLMILRQDLYNKDLKPLLETGECF